MCSSRTRMLYESREARDKALGTGFESGMEAGYARLDELFASQAAAGAARP